MTRFANAFALIGLLAALTTSPVAHQDSALGRRVDELVTQVRSQHQIPGLAVAVVVNSARVYAKGFGSTSLAETPPVTPDTQFRLASVSKAFAAIAVFKLVEQGKLQLDRPARDYCAELEPLNGAPTIRHFLIHQSGMRHPNDAEDENTKGVPPRLGAALRQVVTEKLQFTPGTKTSYTSWGYAALGCAIETASGQSYNAFLKEQVLDRAGMTNTTFDEPAYAAPRFSQGFRLKGNSLAPSVIVDTRFKTPASGLISTVVDLTKFASALFDGTVLTPASIKETVPAVPPGETPVFTAGWTIGQRGLGVPAFEYNGSMEGTTAYLVTVPERKVAVALLANRERFVREISPIVSGAVRAAIQ